MLTRKYTWDEVKRSSKVKDGILALYIYRKVAYVFTYFFANFTNASANHVTTLALVSWLSSAVLIWFGYSVLPAVLIFLGFVFDCTDGNIARLKRQVSNKGKLYDIVADRVGYFVLLVVLALKVSSAESAYVIALAGLLVALMITFDVTRKHVEKIKASDIHDTAVISNAESKIKARLKKLMPSINWNNVIIGVGADLEWTLLLLASVFPTTFTFIITFLIILVTSEIFAIISAC